MILHREINSKDPRHLLPHVVRQVIQPIQIMGQDHQPKILRVGEHGGSLSLVVTPNFRINSLSPFPEHNYFIATNLAQHSLNDYQETVIVLPQKALGPEFHRRAESVVHQAEIEKAGIPIDSLKLYRNLTGWLVALGLNKQSKSLCPSFNYSDPEAVIASLAENLSNIQRQVQTENQFQRVLNNVTANVGSASISSTIVSSPPQLPCDFMGLQRLNHVFHKDIAAYDEHALAHDHHVSRILLEGLGCDLNRQKDDRRESRLDTHARHLTLLQEHVTNDEQFTQLTDTLKERSETTGRGITDGVWGEIHLPRTYSELKEHFDRHAADMNEYKAQHAAADFNNNTALTGGRLLNLPAKGPALSN